MAKIKTFKPMLAAKAFDAKNPPRFPMLGSYKIDGVRGLVRGGRLVSRKLIEFPNRHAQKLFGRPELEGLDLEVIVGTDPTAPGICRITSGKLQDIEWEGTFTAYVIDKYDQPELPFRQRHELAFHQAGLTKHPNVFYNPQSLLKDERDLEIFEGNAVSQKFEGIIVRSLDAPYKYGRSTAKEQGMVKVKRFTDSEMRVTGFEEAEQNNNAATTDELGHTKRSSHKENRTGKGYLGVLVGVDVKTGVEVRVGSGFTRELAQEIWDSRYWVVRCPGMEPPNNNFVTQYSNDELEFGRAEDAVQFSSWITANLAAEEAEKVCQNSCELEVRSEYIGKLVTYKHFEYGVKDKARHPVFKCFRSEDDMALEDKESDDE